MARYTDIDDKKFPKRYDSYGDFARGWNACIGTIFKLPIADVVPKSEVERLHEVIFMKEDLMQSIAKERNYYYYYDELQKAKREVAREIFMDIDRVVEKYSMGDIEYPAFVYIIAELKKKYTEVNNEIG